MKKLMLSLSLVLAFSSATAAFAAIPQKIRIGTDPTYAPFESKNAKGELVGFDIDLANELCKRIKAQCTYVENPLDALIPYIILLLKMRQMLKGILHKYIILDIALYVRLDLLNWQWIL